MQSPEFVPSAGDTLNTTKLHLSSIVCMLNYFLSARFVLYSFNSLLDIQFAGDYNVISILFSNEQFSLTRIDRF